MQAEPNIYIAPSRRPEWDSHLDAWITDFQPSCHASREIVQRLAEADWTAKIHKRELASLQATLDQRYPDQISIDWSAEDQKNWQTLIARHKEAERQFLQLHGIAERARKRAHDLAKEAKKDQAEQKASAKPEPLVAKPAQQPRPLQQTGCSDPAVNSGKPAWTPTNADILRMFELIGEHTISSVVRIWMRIDSQSAGPPVSDRQTYTPSAFRELAERESQLDPDSPVTPSERPFSREVVLR